MSNAATAPAVYLTPPLILSLTYLCLPPRSAPRSRPGLLKAGDQGLPWLADSWPSTSLPANGGLGSPKGGGNFGRGGKTDKQDGVTGNTVSAMPGRTDLMFIQ